MMCAIEANKQPNNGWTSYLMHKRTIKTEKGQTNNALTDKSRMVLQSFTCFKCFNSDIRGLSITGNISCLQHQYVCSVLLQIFKSEECSLNSTMCLKHMSVCIKQGNHKLYCAAAIFDFCHIPCDVEFKHIRCHLVYDRRTGCI